MASSTNKKRLKRSSWQVLRNAHKGYTDLHLASMIGNVNLAKQLVTRGCDLHAVIPDGPRKGSTALHIAGAFGQLKIVNMLLKKGADFTSKSANDQTSLQIACQKHCFNDILEAYLRGGGNVNVVDSAGYTPLHYACVNYNPKFLAALLNHGADVNLTRSRKMKRPIHGLIKFLLKSKRRYELDMVEQLLKHGAYLDAPMRNGRTPVLMAANVPERSGENLLTMCLLNWGCDVNCRDSEGRTPLHYVCQHVNVRMIDVFMRHGADVNAVDRQGDTPFSVALRASFSALQSLDVYSYLKRLTVLGAPLHWLNRDVYERFKKRSETVIETVKDLTPVMENIGCFYEFTLKCQTIPTEEQCRAELDLMKITSIASCATLYDVLQKKTTDLVRHFSEEKLRDILSDTYFDDDYPVYGYLVKIKIKDLKRGGALFRSARETLMLIFRADMPDVFHGILSRLSNNDLINLIEAKELPKKNKRRKTRHESTQNVKRQRKD